MGLSRREFLGTVSVSLSSIMILPIFSAKPLAVFQSWGEDFYPSEYGRNYGSVVDGCSFPIVSFPSKVAPELAEHLQHFRRN